MPEAFICDAIRTPFGRYGGALASRPHRRPRRDPDPRADGAQPRRRLGRGRRRDLRLRQPGRRGQPQRRAHGAAARRAAAGGARRRRSTACAARASTRSAIAARAIKSGETSLDDRRRRREHDARAVRDGARRTARSRARAKIEDTTHRLALRQSADEGEVRRRLDARDRRERRRRLQGLARRPGRVRAAQPGSAPPRPSPPAASPRRSCR